MLNRYRNKGSASIEAALCVPIFMIAMVYVYLVFQTVLTDTAVYEAAAETVEYMAEYSYIDTCTLLVPQAKFKGYADEESRLERYIKNGIAGVSFLGSTMLDEDDNIVLMVRYDTRFAGERVFSIKKRAYTGAGTKSAQSDETTQAEEYVYVTDYESVYHATRTCSHLMLSIRQAAFSYAQNNGYHACAFCGSECRDIVYITEQGLCYHSDVHCSGLKRTVYRRKKSEVQGLKACDRCGRE